MDATSRELERDVRRLREDTSQVLSELENRLAEMTDVRKQAKRHPYAFLGAGVAAFAGLAVLTYGLWTRSHGLGGGIWSFAPERHSRHDGNANGTVSFIEASAQTAKQNPQASPSQGLVKRLMWGLMVSAGLTLAAYLTRRVMETAWTKTTGEVPPGR